MFIANFVVNFIYYKKVYMAKEEKQINLVIKKHKTEDNL